MAEIRSMYKYLILVALVACLAVPSAEGRKIKSMNKKEVNSDMRETAKQGSGSMDSRQSIEGKKNIFPPPTMNFGDSEASYKDDFRSTRRGISRGAGHSFGQGQQSGESESASDNSQEANDFRPTSPGISPGVGHSFAQDQQNAESELIADNSHKAGTGHVFPAVKVAANANLVSPTTATSVAVDESLPPPPPGHDFSHSPGVGHPIKNRSA